MKAVAEWAGSWRVALRLARRAALRARARTALTALMLTLPVYAATVLALAYTATYTSSDTEAAWTMGRADLVIGGTDLDTALDAVPEGSRTVLVSTGRAVVAAGGRHVLHDYEAADVHDPLLQGRYLSRTGRVPQAAGEIAVSRTLADDLGLGLGDRITAGPPARLYTVVGVIDNANELSMPILIVAAAHPLTSDARRAAYVALPSQSLRWRPAGEVSVRQRSETPPAELVARAAGMVLVVGFAATQVALLVGAAFAVSAHRRRRELAMIAAVGAARRHLVRVGLADGVVLGTVAALLGVAGGVVTVRLAGGVVERIANHPLSGNRVPVLWLAGIALFAVGVGVAAALVPARGAARRSVRSAMTSREASTRAGTARWLVTAVLLTGFGALTAVLAAGRVDGIVAVAAGTIAVLLGVTACAPVLVGLVGRLAARLPLAARLAVRHAAQHRLRTAASVAAVCAAVAGSTALALFAAADGDRGEAARPVLRPGQVLLDPVTAARLDPAHIREVAARLPSPTVVAFGALTNRQPAVRLLPPVAEGAATDVITPPTQIAVGGPEVIHAVTGMPAPPEALDVLSRGGAVVFAPELISDAMAEILPAEATGQPVRLSAVLVRTDASYSQLPGMMISARTAAQHRFTALPGGVLFTPVRPPTTAELDAAESTALAAYLRDAPTGAATPQRLAVGVEPAAPGRRFDPMLLVLGMVSAAMTVAAGGITVALSIAEMRDDLSTLAAVGALPALRRRIAGAQAALIVGLGVLLGVAAGIAPAAGMMAFRPDLRWNVPWLPLILTVLIGPLIALVITTLITRPRLVLIRRLH